VRCSAEFATKTTALIFPERKRKTPDSASAGGKGIKAKESKGIKKNLCKLK